MKKKLIGAAIVGVLTLILIQYLIPEEVSEDSSGRPSPRKVAIKKPSIPPRQSSISVDTEDEQMNSAAIAENGITPDILREINRSTSKATITFNGEKYKVVQGFFATKRKEGVAPLFKLFGYSFYKGKAEEGLSREQMSVVVNSNTETLGILTGKISLTLNSYSAIEELSNRYDLDVEYSDERAGVAVVSSSRPVQKIYLALSNDENVTEAELEIIESIHQSK